MMTENIDNKVSKEQLLKQLNDAVTNYKATKALGKENICKQTFENKQQAASAVNNMQKRLDFLKKI